jgi:NADPH-dependent curcumin reductase CurA
MGGIDDAQRADQARLHRRRFRRASCGLLRDMSGWVREGKVKHREFITEGLDSAPGAFMGLLKGANFGKQLVRVGPDKA